MQPLWAWLGDRNLSKLACAVFVEKVAPVARSRHQNVLNHGAKVGRQIYGTCSLYYDYNEISIYV